ncbi:Protein timeless [Nymphon striatum]|nr:Protein timeless [Nymphon striatum]
MFVFFFSLLLSCAGFTDKPEELSSEVVELQEQETDVEEEEMESVRVSEQEFVYADYVKRFATSKVAQAYSKLLSLFDKNSVYTNHCVVKMLHRIAWDCKTPGLFYQACIFQSFQRILKHPSRHSSPDIKELYKFSQYILSNFFKTAATNKTIFIEILFWKNTREVYEIEEGYGTYQQSHGSKYMWTEEQDEELKKLYEEYKETIEPGKDIVDIIMDHIIDETKTRRQVLAQMKSLGLIDKSTLKKSKTSSTRPAKEWSEEEIDHLKTLFEEFKNTPDVVGSIMDNLTIKRSKNKVKDKLLELTLVNDKKELRKRKPKDPSKKKRRKNNDSEVSGNEENAHSSSDSENENFNNNKKNGSEDLIKKISVKEAFDFIQSFCKDERRESISWIEEELSSAAEDRNDSEPEAIPIVPFSSHQNTSMQDETFKSMLLLLGIKPPRNEQESFWRISESITASSLKNRSKILKKMLQNDGTLEEFNDCVCGEEEPVISRTEALQKTKSVQEIQKKLLNPNESVVDSESDEDDDKQDVSKPKSSVKTDEIKKSLQNLDDSSSDEDDEDRVKRLEIDLNQDDEELPSAKVDNVNSDMESNDSEVECSNVKQNSLNNSQINSQINSSINYDSESDAADLSKTLHNNEIENNSSDSDVPSGKRDNSKRNYLNSDSESETEEKVQNVSSNSKKRRLIESDSDE